MSHAARRYYDEPYTTSFDALVIERLEHEGRPAVVLDRTWFYPTSGGQPHDRGTLNERAVVDVTIREADGAVLHVLDAPLPAGRVTGRIDWSRRLDHMQQHTGQHILSQAFIRVADAATIGFHLGAEYVSIDLDVREVSASDCERAFTMANEIVTRDLTVRAWFPEPEELGSLALRKTPEVDGALRVVAVGDFDFSACGGTHVARTGEIGLIHHLGTEKPKRGARVAFLCGGRARRDYAAKQRITSDLTARLTCGLDELPTAVGRLQDELRAARRELARFAEQELDREAERLAGSATPLGSHRVILQSWDGRPADELRALAMKATTAPDVVALFGSAGDRAQFVFARSDASAVDLRPALQAALDVIGGGRGGGARIVQGGGGAATRERVAAALGAARDRLAG